MTKQQLILLLEKYKENKAKLRIKSKELYTLRLKLKSLDEIEISITAKCSLNNDIHSKNQVSDNVGNNVSRNEDKKAELREEIKELEDEVKDLKEKTEIIDDRLECLTYKEKTVLTSYYVEKCSYSDIGNRVYLEIYKETRSEDTIKRIIEKALEKIVKL